LYFALQLAETKPPDTGTAQNGLSPS
jgi:hypothetical protein